MRPQGRLLVSEITDGKDSCVRIETLDRDSYTRDCNNEVAKRVTDECNKILLQQILSALGGSSSATKRIFNETIADADQEQSLALPANIIGYMIRTRGNGNLKLSHVSGESGTNFLTIPSRATHTDDHSYSNLTIYFQSPTVGEIVEVVAWV